MNALSPTGISPRRTASMGLTQKRTASRPVSFGANLPPAQPPSDTVALSLNVVSKVRQLGEVVYNKEQQIIVPAAAVNLGQALGLSPERLDVLQVAGQLYNVGKDPVNNPAWEKAGPLTPDELASVQRYPLDSVNRMIAASTLKRNLGQTAQAERLEKAIPIVLAHKYNYAGGGYPGQNIKGLQIPIEAQILGMVDAYYSMISQRPYRPAMTPQAALQTLQSEAGTKWDAHLVEAFIRKAQ